MATRQAPLDLCIQMLELSITVRVAAPLPGLAVGPADCSPAHVTNRPPPGDSPDASGAATRRSIAERRGMSNEADLPDRPAYSIPAIFPDPSSVKRLYRPPSYAHRPHAVHAR